MSKQSQKEAVYNAVTSVLSENNISVSEGQDVNTLMTKEYRSQVSAILFEGFRSLTIELDRDFNNSDLKAYISGLQSNWLRKDKRLNGGGKYSAKNPGSRAGSGDPSLKAMRALLSTLTSESDKAEVQEAINTRLSEIQVSKIKTVAIDYSILPSDLASKFQK
jgi:hypothetical protein